MIEAYSKARGMEAIVGFEGINREFDLLYMSCRSDLTIDPEWLYLANEATSSQI